MLRSVRAWLGAILILSCSACRPQDSGVNVDMNGFVLGDDAKMPKPLVVGVGETVDQFLARNSFLRDIKIPGGDHVLNLPVLTRTDATYDDGEIKFHIGCSFTTNIDGNNKYVGINSVGFQLCDPVINDWTLATHRAAQIIAEFERQNPHLVSLREFRKSTSLAEAEKVWEGVLFDRWTKVEFPLAEEEVNHFFKKEAAEGHVRQLQYNQNTYVVMAAFMGKKASVRFGISKETYWAGENLTEEQKKTMKYVVVISFLHRKTAATPCVITNDWLRCIP